MCKPKGPYPALQVEAGKGHVVEGIACQVKSKMEVGRLQAFETENY